MSVYWELRTRIEQAAQRSAVQDFMAQFGQVVQDGPFSGMRYLDKTRDPILPKLVGSYEAEIHPWLRSALRQQYRTVIDVGAGEGYYSVGFALTVPSARVYAFDTELDQQAACRKLAKLNGVHERVFVCGEFMRSNFDLISPFSTLLKMDCEGAEFQLLDPSLTPALSACDILVEIHPFIGKPARDLLNRFEHSHTISVVNRQRRHTKQWPSIQFLSPIKRYASLLEFRWDSDLCWAYLRAKRSDQNKNTP
jgi:hypothetical protein